MDWTLAMDRNQKMLLRLVRGLFALVGLSGEGAVASLSRPVALRVFRVLRPAEAATRRLIVIAEFVLPSRALPHPLCQGALLHRGKFRKGPASGFRLFGCSIHEKGLATNRGDFRVEPDPVSGFSTPVILPMMMAAPLQLVKLSMRASFVLGYTHCRTRLMIYRNK